MKIEEVGGWKGNLLMKYNIPRNKSSVRIKIIQFVPVIITWIAKEYTWSCTWTEFGRVMSKKRGKT